MIFCMAIGFLLLAIQGELSLLRIDLPTFGTAALFKEKLTGKCIVGLCLAFAALLMINLL